MSSFGHAILALDHGAAFQTAAKYAEIQVVVWLNRCLFLLPETLLMPDVMKFVAVDLGASSGRLVVGHWDGSHFWLEDLHRFPNGAVSLHGNIYWDVLRIWSEIQVGLTKFRARYDESPAGIGIDAWGVDFALLDRRGRLLDNPSHYRDPRTNGVPEQAFKLISERRIFSTTGVQTWSINTLFQLYSMVRARDPKLDSVQTLLMIPDLFNYFLCGERAIEYTEASTTQMYNLAAKDWDRATMQALSIDERILPRVVEPATVLAPVYREVLETCGFATPFPTIAVASHDTASAVASIPNLDEQSAFISSGTWSLMGLELDAPITSEHAQQLNLTNEGGAGGATLLLRNLTGLWIVQECMRQWEIEGKGCSWDELIAEAKTAQPFRSLVYPDAKVFLAPKNMPAAIRNFCKASGQTVPESRGELARCGFESLSLSYAATLDMLESLTGREIRTLRIVGGGSQNSLLCQLTSDACNRTVVAGPVEASALGNVMLQAVAVGVLPDLAAGRAAIGASVEYSTYTPQTDEAWADAQSRYKSLETASF
jgi:rhamnulokinase